MFNTRDSQADQWAQDIKARDKYICQVCGKYGIYMNSHHLYAWDTFEAERYKMNNGICLCKECHETFHDIYGKGKNTAFQFQEFINTYMAFKKALQK